MRRGGFALFFGGVWSVLSGGGGKGLMLRGGHVSEGREGMRWKEGYLGEVGRGLSNITQLSYIYNLTRERLPKIRPPVGAFELGLVAGIDVKYYQDERKLDKMGLGLDHQDPSTDPDNPGFSIDSEAAGPATRLSDLSSDTERYIGDFPEKWHEELDAGNYNATRALYRFYALAHFLQSRKKTVKVDTNTESVHVPNYAAQRAVHVDDDVAWGSVHVDKRLEARWGWWNAVLEGVNLYQLLGVPRNSTADAVRQAFYWVIKIHDKGSQVPYPPEKYSESFSTWQERYPELSRLFVIVHSTLCLDKHRHQYDLYGAHSGMYNDFVSTHYRLIPNKKLLKNKHKFLAMFWRNRFNVEIKVKMHIWVEEYIHRFRGALAWRDFEREIRKANGDILKAYKNLPLIELWDLDLFLLQYNEEIIAGNISSPGTAFHRSLKEITDKYGPKLFYTCLSCDNSAALDESSQLNLDNIINDNITRELTRLALLNVTPSIIPQTKSVQVDRQRRRQRVNQDLRVAANVSLSLTSTPEPEDGENKIAGPEPLFEKHYAPKKEILSFREILKMVKGKPDPQSVLESLRDMSGLTGLGSLGDRPKRRRRKKGQRSHQ
ncbi:hypothetical protein AAMO2058_001205500 [Amorphochlora amoebiformis]